MTWRTTRQGIGCSLVLGCAMLGLACGSSSGPARQRDLHEALAGAPDWVQHDCHEELRRSGERLACAVGSMGRSRNRDRALATAIARARSEMARTLEIRVRAMLEDYQSTNGGGTELSSGAKNSGRMMDLSHQITQMSLPGSEVRQTWLSESGAVFALVTLDIEHFQATVREMNALSEHLRLAIEARAPEAFGAEESPAKHR